MAGLYVQVGMGMGLTGQVIGSEPVQADGMVIAQAAAACGDAWAALAERDATVARWLDRLTRTGAWGEILAAHMPIVVGIMANHGVELVAEAAPEPAAA